jgi:predicted ArsR family transcriptional regulator
MPGRTDDERGDTGEYGEKYPRELFISALLTEEGDWISTTDVANRVDCPQNTAWTRLDKLKEEGLVKTKKFGNTRVWKLSEEGEIRVQEDDILDYIESEKPVSTSEIVEDLSIDRDELRSFLFDLEERGEIKSANISDEDVWTT